MVVDAHVADDEMGTSSTLPGIVSLVLSDPAGIVERGLQVRWQVVGKVGLVPGPPDPSSVLRDRLSACYGLGGQATTHLLH